ncbi:transcription factor Adf-1-like [Periplaneta americana]|uniref:transcription factor Adf-1-like n=1 Tax=Periplaneta americana TaxID=6978 RepID=UPI0037E8B3E8
MMEVEFKNTLKKDLIWKEIGNMVNKSDGQCKMRWKSIRDHYKRQRKQEKNTGTGSAATKKRASYWDRLRFLDTVEDERESFSNTQTESGNSNETLEETICGLASEATDDPLTYDSYATSTGHESENQEKRKKENLPERSTCQTPETKTKKVRKNNIVNLLNERKQERLQTREYLGKIMKPEAEDETDLFFRTMAATVKKFDPEVRTEAKMKIFSLVTEMEVRSYRSRRVGNASTFDSENSRPSSNASYNSNCSTGESSAAGLQSQYSPSTTFESSTCDNNTMFTNSNVECSEDMSGYFWKF